VDDRARIKFTVPKPGDIGIRTAGATEKHIWEKRVDEYVKRDIRLEESCEKLSLIIGQCTRYMKSKLEILVDYDSFDDTFDVVPLIKAIKSLTYQF
jgi:hypothetical protein